jgi:hypothetical protein
MSNSEPELPMNFMEFHDWSLANTESSENARLPNINYHVLKLSGNCLYIWIGDSEDKMENLSCSMQTLFEKDPLGIEIMMSSKQEQQNSLFGNMSRDLATKLAKKLNKQVFVSFNVDTNLHEQLTARDEPISTLEESYQMNGSSYVNSHSTSQPSLLELIEKSLFHEIKSNPDKF